MSCPKDPHTQMNIINQWNLNQLCLCYRHTKGNLLSHANEEMQKQEYSPPIQLPILAPIWQHPHALFYRMTQFYRCVLLNYNFKI